MKLSKDFLKRNCGCYSNQNGKLEAFSFMKTEGSEVDLLVIMNSEVPMKDKFWFLAKKILTKEQNQQMAIELAEAVLPIYEAKYPDDLQPKEAIEAAKLFITGHISMNELLLKRDAAYAAYAAAYAAAAYAAYADAAYADAAYAYAAADAAAYAYAYAAADAAADAAYAAADAAADAADAAADAADAAKQAIQNICIKYAELATPPSEKQNG